MSLLRAELLQGRRIALAGDPAETLGEELVGLGAEVVRLPLEGLGEDEERVGEWGRAQAPLGALIYRGAGSFGEGGEEAVRATLDEAWAAVREVAVGALIEADAPAKVVLIAPRAGAGPLAGAVAAGLENLARTLSVEWARHQLTAVMVAPGESTEAELCPVVAFLVSEGGGYLSGCRVELGAIG
jgi:NAD(P)-dependent dehydrogenase (short-subunit alcohol dehydrogenase family)